MEHQQYHWTIKSLPFLHQTHTTTTKERTLHQILGPGGTKGTHKLELSALPSALISLWTKEGQDEAVPIPDFALLTLRTQKKR
jgi:hypothetical protein